MHQSQEVLRIRLDILIEEWLAQYSNHISNADPEERQTDQLQREVVVLAEDDREGLECEIKDAKKKSAPKIEQKCHGLEEKKL